MSNYIKFLLSLLIITLSCMNSASKAMDREESISELVKAPLRRTEKTYHSLENSISREPITTYQRDDCCFCLPSCCRLKSNIPPQKGDVIKCVTTHNLAVSNFDGNTQKFAKYRCGYHAVYDEDGLLKEYKPHSRFCWEKKPEEYALRYFLKVISFSFSEVFYEDIGVLGRHFSMIGTYNPDFDGDAERISFEYGDCDSCSYCCLEY